MLKTIKTLLIEATMTYLTDRGKNIHVLVDWDILDRLNGSIATDRAGQPVIRMNISGHSVERFVIQDNVLIFDCRFNGQSVTCIVPTAAIHQIFDPETLKGTVFRPEDDYTAELNEMKEQTGEMHLPKAAKPALPKKKLHLSVVK